MTLIEADGLTRLLADFESTELPWERWRDHATHLQVACAHLLRYPPDEATDRMSAGIKRINAAHGVEMTPTSGYHETMTRCWMKLVEHRLAQNAEKPVPERVQHVVTGLADKKVLHEHYSRDRLMSWEARIGWLEPDLKPLPG
jgi:hypothetical protein